MKKIIAVILSAALICCLYGCGKGIKDDKPDKPVQNSTSTQNPSDKDMNNTDNSESKSETSSTITTTEKIIDNKTTDNGKENTESSKVTIPSEEKEEYVIYGNAEQNMVIYKDIDFGSFEKPHKIGDSVRLRHSDINIGKNDLNQINIYDYDITFEQILTGKKAEQKLKESCSNFEDEKYLLQDNDMYLIKVNIKYNPDSEISDRLPVDIYVAAVDSQGKYVNVEHRFDDSQYTNKTKNGKVSNWYPVLVPKGENIKPVFVMGSPVEYPGPVAAVYFDNTKETGDFVLSNLQSEK